MARFRADLTYHPFIHIVFNSSINDSRILQLYPSVALGLGMNGFAEPR